MKAARFVVRGAGTLSRARQVPREVEHFSRYSPSPLSMKQLLDFGERARGPGGRRRWGLAVAFSPGAGRAGAGLKSGWGPLPAEPRSLPAPHLPFPAPGFRLTGSGR